MCEVFAAPPDMKRLRHLAAHPQLLSCRMSADVFLQVIVRSKPVRQDIKKLGPSQGEQAFRWERPPGQSPKDGFDYLLFSQKNKQSPTRTYVHVRIHTHSQFAGKGARM